MQQRPRKNQAMRNTIFTLLLLLAAAHPAAAENLLDIYRLAAENDPQLRGAEAARLATLESKPQSRALLFPAISANANTTGNRLKNSSSYTLSLTQPVYHHDTYVQLRQADARIAQADALLGAARQDLMLRSATRYFDVLAAQDNLEFARAEKKAIARELEQSRQRFEVGLVAITDVQEAQARFDTALAQEIAAERQLTSGVEALREITARQHDALAVLTEQLPLLTPEPADVEQWTETALKQNPQYTAAQHASEVVQEEVARQRAGHYPTLDIVGNRVFSDETLNDSISLQINAPIFQGGLVTSRTREAQHKYTQAQENQEQQLRSVVRQTRDSYAGVIAGISRVKALQQSVLSHQTALEATEAGSQAGTRTEVDVLDAQRELFRARRDYARARYDYILEGLRLKQAAGTLSQTDLEQINAWLQ